MVDTTACMSTERMDWETPTELFRALDEEFHFTLDVCANEKNHKCERYFSLKDNGLVQRWDGICWMNSPYGRAISAWMAKAAAEAERGATIVCLVPARTDTRWWWHYALRAHEIRFLKGRLTFKGAGNAAPFPSAIIIFRGAKPHRGHPDVRWWDFKPAVSVSEGDESDLEFDEPGEAPMADWFEQMCSTGEEG